MNLIKKKFLFVIAALLFSQTILSQTVLPSSWNCNPGTLPDGWNTNIVNFYTSSSYTHSPPNAIKFDATAMFLTINFVDEPDTLSYYLRGASFLGGTFDIQQSVNGSVWTTLRTFITTNIPNSSLASAAPFKDALNANSRFVRFIYTIKASGNVCVDDILVSKRPPRPEANIKIKLNNQFVPIGGLANIGNSSAVVCRVINEGTDSVLLVSAASITGANAAMFSITGLPLNVPPIDSANFSLNFIATGADGSKTATLSLANNDLDKNPYVFNIWGVKGCCATEPAHSAINLTISDVNSFKFRVNFADNITVPDKYLVLKKTSPITEEPLDGHNYLKGDYIGGAQVAYIGPAGYFYPSNVVAGTPYYIKVFSCNGYPGYENYLTTNPAAADTATMANMMGNYYGGTDVYSSTLWNDLHVLINNHIRLSYDDYDLYLINDFETRDTVVDGRSQKALTCVYSGENYVYTPPFAFNVYSREHAFCQSWMPSVNAPNFTSLPEYSDYHNLFPVNQNKVNVYRLNFPLGIVDSVTYQYLGCKKGFDSLGHIVFEPRDNIKGDVARAMMYQILCYDGVDGRDWYLPVLIDSTSTAYGQDQTLLKQWHQQDQPDNYEIARNDNIYFWQQNRNPFIDHPEWVEWFGFGVNSSIGEVDKSHGFSIYPNPSHGVITLVSDNISEAQFDLYDIAGALQFSANIKGNSKNTINLNNYPAGMYFYRLTGKEGESRNGKLVIER